MPPTRPTTYGALGTESAALLERQSFCPTPTSPHCMGLSKIGLRFSRTTAAGRSRRFWPPGAVWRLSMICKRRAMVRCGRDHIVVMGDHAFVIGCSQMFSKMNALFIWRSYSRAYGGGVDGAMRPIPNPRD